MRDLEGIAEINGPRRAELQAERAANAERARIQNLDWRARVAERQRNLRHTPAPVSCRFAEVMSRPLCEGMADHQGKRVKPRCAEHGAVTRREPNS
jgi:hypothetical protein